MSVVEPGSARAGLVGRVMDILTRPSPTWEVIDREPASVKSLYTGYVMPLAAIPVIATLIGGLVFGYGGFGVVFRPSPVWLVTQAVVSYALSLAMVFVLALIIEALAPNFGATKDRVQAMKVAAYAPTASWVAGVVGLVPAVAILAIVGGIYSLVLLYKGLPRVMKSDPERTTTYFIVILVVAVVLNLVIGMVAGSVLTMGGAMRVADRGAVSGKVTIPGAGSVDLGKLEEASKRAEAVANQMQNGQGPKATDPEALKAYLPESVAGYARTEVSAETGGAGGMQASTAQGTYAKGDASLRLTVSDMGAAGAIAGLANAFDVNSSKDNGTSYEKVGRVNGRMTQESYDRQSKHGEYSVLVGERFMIQAEGDGVSIDDLKAAVGSVPAARLEGLAKAG
jgi:hypothetical protein